MSFLEERDTDVISAKFAEAKMMAENHPPLETIPNKKISYNEATGKNDILIPNGSGGHIIVGEAPEDRSKEIQGYAHILKDMPFDIKDYEAAGYTLEEVEKAGVIPTGQQKTGRTEPLTQGEQLLVTRSGGDLAKPPSQETLPVLKGFLDEPIKEVVKGLVRGTIVKPAKFFEDNFGFTGKTLRLQIVNPDTGEFDLDFKILDNDEVQRQLAENLEKPFYTNLETLVQEDEEAGGGSAFAGGLAQFFGAYVSIAKFFKFGKSLIAQGASKGAAADYLAFEGDEGRITDILSDLGVPEKFIPSFLVTDPNDPDYIGRFKTSIEGLGTGVIAEGLLRFIGRTFRAIKDGDVPAEEVQQITEEGNKSIKQIIIDRLNQPGEMPTVGSTGGNVFAPGQKYKTIPPSNKQFSADEINEAKMDTRKSADIVAERLNKIVPEAERVNGGTYTPGTPDGKKWSTLPNEKLSQRGGGANFNDADLERIWNETLSEVSESAKNSVAETGATWNAFPAASWDKALRLPVRSQLWYELSGEDFLRRLPGLSKAEHMMFLDLVGATSARAKPKENLERSLAVLSQQLRGVPIDVDLTTPSTVTDALNRGGQNVSSDLANKTGMFSDTLGIVAGVPLRYPISVNDVWVGKAFGITDDQLSQNQALHEVFGKYMNKIREQVNSGNLHEFPHESWQLQARQWVEMRAADQGVDTSQKLSIEGNDYAGEFGGIIKKLEDAGIAVPGGIITRDILMKPEFADALRPTTQPFREAPKATVEFGTLLTPAGEKGASLFAQAREVGDKLTQKEYLQTLTSSMYSSGRGKGTIWEKTVRLATDRSDKVTRIVYPTSENPFAVSGTFEGAAAPNIRVPLKELNADQIAYFNAMAGKGLKQKAMAAAEIRLLDNVENLPEGFVETSSIFIPWTGNVPEELVIGVSNALGEGYEVSVAQYPNGLKVDVNPRFTDDGIESPNAQDIDNVGQFLENTYNVTNIEESRSAYKSDYGKNYVEDDGTGEVYDGIIETTLKGWTDEATNKIAELGVPKSIARKFVSGSIDRIPKIDGKTSEQIQSIRQKSGTIKKRLRTRIDNHNEMTKAWQSLGEQINAKMESQLGSWEKRLSKAQK
jgi:hypothetical protein